MVFEDYQKKSSAVVVFTGEGKGKTSAGLGLMVRALGAGHKVAFVQFIKQWDVSEHKFIDEMSPVYKGRLCFYKGGLGFVKAGELSSKATIDSHREEAKKTYDFALDAVVGGDYGLVICDEINNAVHEGLLKLSDLRKLIVARHAGTSICLTGRYFPDSLIEKADIVTEMKKTKHHYDEKFLAIEGIDY